MDIIVVREIFNMLTGTRLPDGIAIESPHLSPSQAFGVIYFLQEHSRIIPDHFELCDTCQDIFDRHAEGDVGERGTFCGDCIPTIDWDLTSSEER